jgi:ribosome maturation factor RimP
LKELNKRLGRKLSGKFPLLTKRFILVKLFKDNLGSIVIRAIQGLFFLLWTAGKPMQYKPRDTENRKPDDDLFFSLDPVIRGLGMSLVELNVFHGKARGGNPPSVHVRAIVYRDGATGVDDCSRVHRGVLPRLELVFPGQDIYLEVSSPGIDRIIKSGSEFHHYIGKGVKCYRTDISDWTAGILNTVDEEKIVLGLDGEVIELPYEVIAKARLASEI